MNQAIGSILSIMAPVAVAKIAGSRRKRSWASSNGGRRGNPGNFHGARLKFLNEQFPHYRIARQKKDFKAFWARIYSMYWDQFPWWLPMDTNPSTENLVAPDPMTDELMEKKKDVIQKTNKVTSLHLYKGLDPALMSVPSLCKRGSDIGRLPLLGAPKNHGGRC